MRAARTGGGLVRIVVIWPVVLAVLVMTATGASSTTAVAFAATATATAATATITAAAAAAAIRRTGQQPPPSPSPSPSQPPPPPPRPPVTDTPAADHNATDGTAACETVQVSLREPACTEPISEGPGPPRCPAAIPCAPPTDNDNDNNNYDNNNNNNNNDKKYNNVNHNYNNNDNGSNNVNNDNNNNTNNSNHQCLEYARRDLVPAMCSDDWPGQLSRYRLRYCCHHTVESVVQQAYMNNKSSCEDQVNKALDMDDIAAAMSCQFNEVLARYDCKQKYSAKSCDSCKDAYALWACAAVLPHWTWMTGNEESRDRYRVNACRSVCLAAEQKCPWLLPVADDANPYAGEASFTCIDPDIWFQTSPTDVTEQCCYEHCADGLCVRNASLCNGGGAADPLQRPVCVKHVTLTVEESLCTDYSLTDTSSGRGRTELLPPRLLLSAALALAATAAAAVT